MAQDRRPYRPLQFCRSMRALSFTLGVALLAGSTGCHTWQPETAFPQRPADHARDARVTLKDGRRLFLENVRVEGDSVVGDRWEGYERHAFALSQVRRVEGRRLDIPATVVLTVGVTAIGSIAVLSILLAATGGLDMGAGW